MKQNIINSEPHCWRCGLSKKEVRNNQYHCQVWGTSSLWSAEFVGGGDTINIVPTKETEHYSNHGQA